MKLQEIKDWGAAEIVRDKRLTREELAKKLRKRADKNNPVGSQTPVVNTMDDDQTPDEPKGFGQFSPV